MNMLTPLWTILLAGMISIQFGIFPNVSFIPTEKIQAPQILTPQPMQELSGPDCLLSWTSSAGADKYEVWVSDSKGFENCGQFVVTDTFHHYTTPHSNRCGYYWKVRAWKTNSSFSDFSEIGVFYASNPAVEIQLLPPPHGCNGNCSNCRNPCGRRPSPNYEE